MATTNLSHYDKTTIPNANHLRFGIVVSEWNSDITENLKNGAIKTLLDCGAKQENIISWTVPGSFELVYGCKRMIETLQLDATYDIFIRTEGGGLTGQSDAIRLGCARALCMMNPEYRSALKGAGFLTRIALKKERKKYGLKKARKAPQFSKR